MNKKIAYCIIGLFIVSATFFAENISAQVAKVDYSEIDDLLCEVVLAQPENKELGERYLAQEAKAKATQKRLTEAMMKGEKMDTSQIVMDTMGPSEDKKKVELLSEKLLLEIIEKTVDQKYQVILKSSYGSSILYTKEPLDDVTDLVRQELLKQMPSGK